MMDKKLRTEELTAFRFVRININLVETIREIRWLELPEQRRRL